MRNKSATGLIVAALVLLVGAPAVAGQRAKKQADTSPALNRSPVRCLWLPRIAKSKVVDDRTILFYTRNGEVYRNILERQCPGLGRAGRFAYRVNTSQLCSVDNVTVLDQFPNSDPLSTVPYIGVPLAGLSPGLTCPLGKFYPITALEAKDMLAGPKGALAERNEIDVQVVKLPPQDEDGAAKKDTQAAAGDNGRTDRGAAQDVQGDKTSKPSAGTNQQD